MRSSALPLLLAASLAVAAPRASALPPELNGLVRSQAPAGCSEFNLLFWKLYRAELWSEHDKLPGNRFALSLTYRTDFTRQQLVDSSISEMARLSGQSEEHFASLRDELSRSFRDVAPGDRLTAWREGADLLRFFMNGRETGILTRYVDLFLSIWLGERARDGKGRQALLSGQCNG